MWTWLKAELEYRKQSLISALLFSLLAPPVLAGTMVLLDVSKTTLRDVYLMYSFVAFIPIMILGSTRYLREESRGLLTSGLPLRSIDVGTMRLGFTFLLILIYSLSVVITSLLATLQGIDTSWQGVFVFFLFNLSWILYSLILEHIADFSRQALLAFSMFLPYMIPEMYIISFIVLPSTSTMNPLFSFFSNVGWLVLFAFLNLVFAAVLLLVARSGRNHRVLLGNHRYAGA